MKENEMTNKFSISKEVQIVPQTTKINDMKNGATRGIKKSDVLDMTPN